MENEIFEAHSFIENFQDDYSKQICYTNNNIDTEEYISSVIESQSCLFGTCDTKFDIEKHNLLRVYFSKWKESLQCRANPKCMGNERTKMIDKFFTNVLKTKQNHKGNHLSKEKISENTPSSVSSSNNLNDKHHESYHHRYQAQKNIIALQKLKLQHQERIIEELKLKKYVEDNNCSNNLISDVRKTLQNCDKTLKPKLKCITGIDQKHDEENDDIILPYCMKVPKLIQKMEQRAREREEKRAIVRERRRQMELEKQQAKEQMELEKQIMDQEEKNRRLNEYKEKRKHEQLIAIRRKEMREKMRALTVMADLHYENKLREKYGIRAFKLYLDKLKADYESAVRHHICNSIKSHFIAWKKYANEVVTRRTMMAETMMKTKLLQQSFRELKVVHRTMVKKRQVAEDWYEFHITEKLFVLWRHNTRKLKYQRKKQYNLAARHYDYQLLWKVMGCWQTLPTINRLEREQETRKHKWRLKVQQVLPDFIPLGADDMDDIKYIT